MPHKVSSRPAVVPFKKGSVPVKDVLQRISVQEVQRVPQAEELRPDEGVSLERPKTWAVLLCLAAVIGAGMALQQFSKPVQMRRPRSVTVPAPSPVAAEVGLMVPIGVHPVPLAVALPIPRERGLSIPSELHPQAPVAASQGPAVETPMVAPSAGPANVHVTFLGPRTIELRWDSLGEGFRYVLYSSKSIAFDDAQPVLQNMLPSTHAIWTPDDDVQSVWVAIKGIDAQHRATSLSPPMHLQLPPV